MKKSPCIYLWHGPIAAAILKIPFASVLDHADHAGKKSKAVAQQKQPQDIAGGTTTFE